MTLSSLQTRLSIRLGIVALLVSLGCTGPGGRAGRVAPLRREVLSRDEIMSSSAQHGDLYEAIRSLRPNFLMRDPGVHSNASTSSLPLAVFIGNARQGGPESLRSIAANSIVEARYYDPVAAQNRFGPSASGGALVITLYDPSRQPDAAMGKPPAMRTR